MAAVVYILTLQIKERKESKFVLIKYVNKLLKVTDDSIFNLTFSMSRNHIHFNMSTFQKLIVYQGHSAYTSGLEDYS